MFAKVCISKLPKNRPKCLFAPDVEYGNRDTASIRDILFRYSKMAGKSGQLAGVCRQFSIVMVKIGG